MVWYTPASLQPPSDGSRERLTSAIIAISHLARRDFTRCDHNNFLFSERCKREEKSVEVDEYIYIEYIILILDHHNISFIGCVCMGLLWVSSSHSRWLVCFCGETYPSIISGNGGAREGKIRAGRGKTGRWVEGNVWRTCLTWEHEACVNSPPPLDLEERKQLINRYSPSYPPTVPPAILTPLWSSPTNYLSRDLVLMYKVDHKKCVCHVTRFQHTK